MISCLNIPENTTPYSFISNLALKYDTKDCSTCLVLPTERNLRYMANFGFKYVEPYAVSNFFDLLIDTDKKIMPVELRAFYLKKAVNKLTNEEITAVFKSDNKEFLQSFIPFAQNAKNIFSFFRELFTEMVDVENLVKASQYSDYERQINILNHLWNIYLDIIHDDGWIDKYETYKNINLNNIFINRYDNYIFLISGFLTRYELTVFKKISETRNVIIVFNYAGPKQSQHKEYEAFFKTDCLHDKNLPVFTNSNMQIYSCISDISQIELITKKAFELHEKNNIPFNRMAVIIPDTSCKTYFIKLDYYNIFDVSAGRDISSCSFISFIESLTGLYTSFKSGLIEISFLINILSNDMLQKDRDVQQFIKNLYKMLENNKLYLQKDEFLSEQVISEYLASFFNTPEFITAAECIKTYQKLLNNILPLFQLEVDVITETQTLLEKLAVIYKYIDDLLLFEEAAYMIMNEINNQSIDLPKKEIAVTGILESRNIDYDILFIPYMTEDLFPQKNAKDLFINTEIKKQLQLPTFIDRENLMKNYLYQLMSSAKATIISYSENNSGARRSSFIEELAIKNHLTALKYAPQSISLMQEEKYYYPKDTAITIEKTDKIIKYLKDFSYSASNLNIYTSCSLRFYLQYVLGIEEKTEPIENLDNRAFGIVLHNVFKTLFDRKVSVTDKTYQQEFQNEFLNQIKEYDAYKYNNVEQFITSIIYNNIPKIAEAEQNHIKSGYEVINREYKVQIKFNNFNIKGIIDKIEKYENDIIVTDYKYKDEKKIKPVLNNQFEKIDDIQLPVYALLLDYEMKQLPAELFYLSIKEKFEYKQGFDINFYDDFKDYLAKILKEIVDISIPFEQTKEYKHCDYCPYVSVCGRENGFFTK